MFNVVSFYTDLYKEQADKMIESAKNVGLDTKAIRVEDRGSWSKNTRIKAEIVLKELEYGNVVYVDADARFLKYPSLFDNLDCDVAFHRLNNPGNQNELLGGTLFFKSSEKVKDIVKEWIIECNQEDNVWEQQLLDKVIKRNDLNIYLLSVEYCAIFDHPSIKGKDVVILHTQASRQLKAQVNQRS